MFNPVIAILVLGIASQAHAAESTAPSDAKDGCLPGGAGYMRARIAGALNAELRWDNETVECTGAVRPTDGGVRARFSGPEPEGEGKLVLVFGVAKLREGDKVRLSPVNVTVMREGRGEFYSTQGDDKCMLDEAKLEPIVGIPHRSRSYRFIARGACTEPARAVRGKGAIMLSRFDFAGRVDFEEEQDEPKDDAGATLAERRP